MNPENRAKKASCKPDSAEPCPSFNFSDTFDRRNARRITSNVWHFIPNDVDVHKVVDAQKDVGLPKVADVLEVDDATVYCFYKRKETFLSKPVATPGF